MLLTPDTLVSGPRGRRLVLEYALESERTLLANDADHPLSRAIFDASRALEPDLATGSAVSVLTDGEPMPETSPLTPDDVARRLSEAPILTPSPDLLLRSLANAVESARYWQEPDGDDMLAADPAVCEQLARLAGAILESSYVSWWTEGFDLDHQHSVQWEGSGRRPRANAGRRLADWHRDVTRTERRAVREYPTDPEVMLSGEWWSTPPSELLRTSRELTGFGPCGLWLVEDGLGWKTATTRAVRPTTDLRVYEVDGADAWAALCREHPIDVSAHKRHDWYRTTGRVGRWVVPDWNAVAQEYDAVHLTVGTYLAAAGTVIDVRDQTASVIAGWSPDETYWFTDAADQSDETTPWSYTEEETWERLQR